MIRVVSWNINKRTQPWQELVDMARDGDADVALLQEAGSPPGNLVHLLDCEDQIFWHRNLYDRWPLVIKLSERVRVETYRQVAPISELAEDAIGVSGIGTIAAAKVIPCDCVDDAFIAVSMYARWLKPHPSTRSSWGVGYSDASAHRIISDLSAFIGHRTPDPPKSVRHRVLAAGDLNMFYGATGYRLSLPERERTVWKRMKALGLEFMGPQATAGRVPATGPDYIPPDDVPTDTKNVPTYYAPGRGPKQAANQLDYAFASRGFHESVSVRAMNAIEEWGSSDHCRLLIEVRTRADRR